MRSLLAGLRVLAYKETPREGRPGPLESGVKWGMINFKRVRQETGSYCGPAVFEMLVAAHGLELDQEKMVDACGARSSVMKVGITLKNLAKGLRNMHPELVVWQKLETKLEDIETLLAKKYLVGVDWQGIFTGDEYGDDEISKWEIFWNRVIGTPELKGEQGHYCIIMEIDLKKGNLRFADPYGHYAGKDRFVATWEFEERWWDDRIDKNEKGRKVRVVENRLIFLVTKKEDEFPASLGMERI